MFEPIKLKIEIDINISFDRRKNENEKQSNWKQIEKRTTENPIYVNECANALKSNFISNLIHFIVSMKRFKCHQCQFTACSK